jgi:hypothetical protein
VQLIECGAAAEAEFVAQERVSEELHESTGDD